MEYTTAKIIKTNVAISTHGGKYAPEKPLLSLTIRDLLNYKDIYDHVSKVIKDQIVSKMQGAVSISIRNSSNTINSLMKIDVPDVSHLVDELLWTVRCDIIDMHYTSLCVEAFGNTSSIDILPKGCLDLIQWIRVSIDTYLKKEKVKFEYENKHLDGVECDMCIAFSDDMYSSLKLPKTNIAEDLPEDCYTGSHRLSILTIRMIQEEMI